MHTIGSCPNRGNHDRSCHRHNTPYHDRLWRHRRLGLKSLSPPRTRCSIHLFWPMRWWQLSRVKSLLASLRGNQQHHVNRETSFLAGEFPEESVQFRFIRAVGLANLKGSIGLMLVRVSDMRVTTPLDLSTRSIIPLPRFIHTRTGTMPLLTPSLVLFTQSSD
jgi:hypothetical protein